MLKDNNTLIYFFVSVIIAALVGFLLISPAYQKVKADRVEYITALNTYQTQKALQENINEINSKTKSLRTELDKLAVALPAEEESETILVQLENIATDASMKLLAISPQPTSDLEVKDDSVPYQHLDVMIQLSGTYAQFKTFLEKIEKNLRIIDIQSINMNPSLSSTQSTSAAEESSEEDSSDTEDSEENTEESDSTEESEGEEEKTATTTTTSDQSYTFQIKLRIYYQNK